MAELINVLITGLGGPLGVSVFKALRLSSLRTRVIGTDVNARAFGLYLADKAILMPRADTTSDAYLARLRDIIQKEHVDIVFPCSENELVVLAQNKDYFTGLDCQIFVNSLASLERTMDKYLLATDLRSAGLSAPDSTIPGSYGWDDFIANHGFPLILKARLDSGSRNLYLVHNRAELDFFSGYVRLPVVQELLLPDDEEYTVGVFTAPEGRGEGTIILRRQLAAGLTFKAEVVENREIHEICLKTIKHLGLKGANNVQLRLTARGPCVFEVNPRFSSSTVIRAFYGFNEPELAIRAFLRGEMVIPRASSGGVALRMWDEIYVDTAEVGVLDLTGEKDMPEYHYGLSMTAPRGERKNRRA